MTGRLKDAAFKIGVLGSGTAGAALVAVFGPGSWRSAFITLTCALLLAVIVALSDAPTALAHPVRWSRFQLNGSAMPAGSPQYTAFPLDRFLASLKTVREVSILDTRLFLLDDEYRAAFVTALIGAIERGARVTIVLLCP